MNLFDRQQATALGFAFGLHMLGFILGPMLLQTKSHQAITPPQPLTVSLIEQAVPVGVAPTPPMSKLSKNTPVTSPAPRNMPEPVVQSVVQPVPRPVAAQATVAENAPKAVMEAAASTSAPAPAPAPAVVTAVPVQQAVKTAVSLDASYANSNPRPPYPAIARRLGEEGTVYMRVLVATDGSADKVELKKSSGSQTLDQSALETIKKWKFNPAKIDGKPVAEWYETRWTFKLEG